MSLFSPFGQAYFYALGKSLASTANVIVVNHHPNWVLDDYERGGSSGARRDRVGGRFSFLSNVHENVHENVNEHGFGYFFSSCLTYSHADSILPLLSKKVVHGEGNGRTCKKVWSI